MKRPEHRPRLHRGFRKAHDLVLIPPLIDNGPVSRRRQIVDGIDLLLDLIDEGAHIDRARALDIDEGAAFAGRRGHVLDAVHRGDGLLDPDHDLLFHLLLNALPSPTDIMTSMSRLAATPLLAHQAIIPLNSVSCFGSVMTVSLVSSA